MVLGRQRVVNCQDSGGNPVQQTTNPESMTMQSMSIQLYPRESLACGESYPVEARNPRSLSRTARSVPSGVIACRRVSTPKPEATYEVQSWRCDTPTSGPIHPEKCSIQFSIFSADTWGDFSKRIYAYNAINHLARTPGPLLIPLGRRVTPL